MISTLLPGLVRDFSRQYPEIEFVALECTDEEVEEWLAAETVDLGVVLNPAPDRTEVILGRDVWVALLPASHRLGRRTGT